MTAKKDEPERVVVLEEILGGELVHGVGVRELGEHAPLVTIERRTSDAIDGLVEGGAHEPRRGVVRDVLSPLLEGGNERFLHGVLREVEIVEPAHECGVNAHAVLAVRAGQDGARQASHRGLLAPFSQVRHRASSVSSVHRARDARAAHPGPTVPR